VFWRLPRGKFTVALRYCEDTARGVVELYALHHAKLGVAGEYAQRVEVAPDVGCGTPRMAYLTGSFPRTAVAPLAHTEENGTACGAEGVADELIGALRIDVFRVAPVIFQVVNTPSPKSEKIIIINK